MRTKYAFFSLIVLMMIASVSGMSQGIPKHRAMTWFQKLQNVEKMTRGDASAFTTANVQPQLQRQLIQTWDETEWVDDEEIRYTYSGANPQSEVSRTWNGSEWVPSEKTSYSVNGSNQIEVVLYEEYAGNGEYVAKERTLFSYGFHFGTGKTVVDYSEYQVWSDSEWQMVSRDTYTYHITPTSIILNGWIGSYWNGDDWVEDQKMEMAASGDNLVQTDYLWTGSWTATGRTIYLSTSLPDYEQILTDIEDQFRNHISLPLLMTALPEMIEQEPDGGEWHDVMMTTKIPMYSWMSGKLIQMKTEVLEWDGEEWEAVIAYTVDYNEDDGKPWQAGFDYLISEETYRFSEDLFEYNGQGLLHSAVLRINYGEDLMNVMRQEFDWAGTGTGIGDGSEFPQSFNLGNGYPNPFNPVTTIPYETGVAGHVTIRVYDILGRHVATLINGQQPAGMYQIRFDAAGLGSGKYLIHMEAPGYSQTRSVTLVK